MKEIFERKACIWWSVNEKSNREGFAGHWQTRPNSIETTCTRSRYRIERCWEPDRDETACLVHCEDALIDWQPNAEMNGPEHSVYLLSVDTWLMCATFWKFEDMY